MRSMGGSKAVLIVAEEPDEVGGLVDPEVTVDVLTDHRDVFDVLTTSGIDCLVLPTTIDDQPAVNIAYGIADLFPELPIVLAGADPAAVPDDLDVVAVESGTLVDEAVAAAVRGCLDGDSPSVAGRPPSPMETLLLSLFDEMPHHLYAKDDDARHVMMGRGFNEPTDRLGLTDSEVGELQDDHGEAALQDELALIEERTDRIEVEEFLDLSAEYVDTVKVPWYDSEGEVRGIAGLTQDITEQKRREHAFQRQHERMVKTALVAAHELRNELQIAHGRLDQVDGEQSRLERVENSLSRLESIVDTIVSLSETEPTVEQQKPVWLSRLSREVWNTIAESDATLEIESDARVLADQDSASLLLQNLFKDAVAHAGPAVTATVGATEDGFFVADDGPGIDADPPERIFDAGFTTVEGNTGFGLYVVQMVADSHDWTVAVSDSDAGGARFDIGNVDLA